MKKNWIENAIIYQIYPMTFHYAEGSESDPYKGAFGNFKGITEKADYVKDLGADAIWLCPFYKWNRNGMGYDITDYEEVSPMFGTKEDFKELVDTYHSKGIKVIIDGVFNHCSMEHEWFKKSVKREEPYADYFVWQDPKGFTKDGKPIPPTNWEPTWDSSETGSVWQWNEERQQFYLHSFDYTMPNLNLNNSEVQKKMLKILKSWFDMGVDGVRLDGTCHYGYDSRLLDNPIIGKDIIPNLSKEELELENGKQMRIYDINLDVGRKFIDAIKKLANSYKEAKATLAEYVFDKGIFGNRKGCDNIRNSICDTFYTGALRGELKDFRTGVESMLKPQNMGRKTELAVSEDGSNMNWALSNHDMERVVSRWFGSEVTPETSKKAKMAMKMLLALPGSICIFQGEELGLPNPNIERAKNPKNDPLKLTSLVGAAWDATRTSIAWLVKGTNMWLKPTPEQRVLAAEIQEVRPNSMLNETRKAIQWRKKHKVLNKVGYLDFIDTDNPEVIAFIRSDKERKNSVALCFNYTDKPSKVKIPLPNNKFKVVTVPPVSMVQSDFGGLGNMNYKVAQNSLDKK